MQPTDAKPIVLRKSTIGLVGIYVGGFVGVTLLSAAATLLLRTGQSGLSSLLYLVAGITIILTAIQSYIYGLTLVIITKDEITLKTWTSLLTERVDTAEWRHVQDVNFSKRGLVSMMFDVGTLLVETAATERNLRITYISNVEHWRDYCAQLAEVATIPITEAPATS